MNVPQKEEKWSISRSIKDGGIVAKIMADMSLEENPVQGTSSKKICSNSSSSSSSCQQCEKWAAWPKPRKSGNAPWPIAGKLFSHFKTRKIVRQDQEWHSFFEYCHAKGVHTSICYQCWADRNIKKLVFNVYDTCPLLFTVLCHCPKAPYPITINQMSQFYGDIPLRETLPLTFVKEWNELFFLIDRSIEISKKTPSHERLVLAHRLP